jgi:hypothetical protein
MDGDKLGIDDTTLGMLSCGIKGLPHGKKIGSVVLMHLGYRSGSWMIAPELPYTFKVTFGVPKCVIGLADLRVVLGPAFGSITIVSGRLSETQVIDRPSIMLSAHPVSSRSISRTRYVLCAGTKPEL